MRCLASLLLLCLLPGNPDDAPAALPTLDQVVDRLERTESLIENLSVTTKYVRHEKFLLPASVRDPVRMEMATDFVVDAQGRSWYECQGEQVNFGPKPDEVRVYKGRWRGAYDGKEATALTGGVDGEFHFGEISDHPSWHGVNPLEYTTRYSQKRITETLQTKGGRVVERETRLSRPVVVVDTEPVTVDGVGWKQRFWVDMERGVVIRRASLLMRNPEQGWREYTRIESSEHQEIAPGVWLPLRIMYESVTVPKEGGPEETSWKYEGVNADWKLNRALPADRFRLKFPADVPINDHRKPRPAKAG